MLHPSFKLDYFWNRGWEPAWISTAEEMVRDEFEHSYADLEVPENHEDAVALMNKPLLSLSKVRNCLVDDVTYH